LASSYVDVLQLHYPDAATVGNAAVWQALEDVKAQGKIRYYGIALGPGPGGLEEGRAAMRKHDLGCIQTYYNLLEEEPGRKFFPVALEINQGMVIRAPHAGGVLESNPDAVRFPADGDLQVKDSTWTERARKQAANLRWVYEGKGMTLSQAALKFILSEETVASALPNIHREGGRDGGGGDGSRRPPHPPPARGRRAPVPARGRIAFLREPGEARPRGSRILPREVARNAQRGAILLRGSRGPGADFDSERRNPPTGEGGRRHHRLRERRERRLAEGENRVRNPLRARGPGRARPRQ